MGDTIGSWVYNNNQNSWIKATGNWINNEIFQTPHSIDSLKVECSKIFGDTDINRIHVTIKDTNYTQQYSIISYNTPLPLMEKELKFIHYTDVLDYPFILALAYASHYAYRTEIGQDKKDCVKNNYNLNDIASKNEFNLIPNSELKSNISNIHSVSFINEKKKIIIIAYKGSSNYTDFLIDSQLIVANSVHLTLLSKAVDEAVQIYQDTLKIVKNNYKNHEDYKVVLTGHSLGAFYAPMVAVNQNLPARVFSSPATHINMTSYSSYFNFYSNIPFYNVINFVRYSDPVNAFSGRHVENRIYFKETENYDISKNHSLIGMINDIFEKQVAPYYFEVKPTYSHFTMNDNSYFGMKKLIHFQGYTSARMLSSLCESELKLNEESFNIRDKDNYL